MTKESSNIPPPPKNVQTRTIFCYDNLPVLRGINSGSVDLIYLDPPFNKGRNFHAPIGTSAEGASFHDIWSPDEVKDEWHNQINDRFPKLYKYLDAVGEIGSRSAKYYLIYMAVRLVEMKRVLKDTGSLYLHCDPTASHYLKLLLDTIFGHKNYINEITWPRYAAHSLSKLGVDNIADVVLFYSKDRFKKTTFNNVYGKLEETEIKNKFPYTEEETGRDFQHIALEQNSNKSSAGEYRIINGKKVFSDIGWRWSQETFDKRLAHNPYLIYWTKNGRPRYKKYADEYEGIPLGNIWSDIPYLSSGDKEKTGYPTQKPLKLLERIINASSNEGGMVLDPFCGCATTCIAAEKLGRQWVGIDVSEKAYDLVKDRLKREVPPDLFRGEPVFRKDIPFRTDIDYKKAPTKEDKKYLYGHQNGRCVACKTKFEIQHLEVDHIIPRSQGGGHERENLQLLCGNCNRRKGDRPMEYLMARLKAA